MKDLSITQEYLLCALNKKGKIPAFGNEIQTCFVAGALLELLNNEFVKIQDKKVVINKKLDETTFGHLRPLYSFIERLNDLIQSVGDSLVAADCAEGKKERGIFGGEKARYFAKAEGIEYVVQKIRAELLEDGDLSDETVCLTSLFNKSGLLKQYFSRYESKQLNDRINEIKNSESNRLVKEMLDYIDTLILVVIVSSSSGK